MKIVGLIPSIIKRRNSNYLMVDHKLISFISKCFPRHKIKILTRAEKTKLDYIISLGSTLSYTNNHAISLYSFFNTRF